MNNNENSDNLNNTVGENSHAEGLFSTMIFMIIAVTVMITIRYFLNY